MPTRPNRPAAPAINASSMADIAFLLLIFFLVSTEIPSEAGILVRLPEYDPTERVTSVSQRNTFNVLVNGRDELLLEGDPARAADVVPALREFLTNPQAAPDLPSDPRKAVVSLQNDRSTSYGAYLEIYNELQRGYRGLWNEEAQRRFGLGYDDERLADSSRAAIRAALPMVISEAEPTDWFGE